MMRDTTSDGGRRGAVQVVDAILSFVVLVGLLVLAPYFYKFTAMAAARADSFSSLLLGLVLPFLFIALFISMGVSARRGA